MLILGDAPGMKPYSVDLRSRVLDAVDRGVPRIAGREDLLGFLALYQALAQAQEKETGALEPRQGVPTPPARKGAALEE